MKTLSLAFLVALGAISTAEAQQARIVSACGSIAPFGAQPAGGQAYATMDVNGNLCTNATSGGGGGGVVQQGAKDATAVPWAFDTTGTGNLDTEVKAPLAAGTAVIGYTSADPCAQASKLSAPFAITSAIQTPLVAAVPAKRIYICSINLITGLANNVNIYGVGAAGACSAAATEAVIGANSNAATNGWNFAANGGLTLGSGMATIANTVGTNVTLCVVTSSAGPLSGNLTYVQQ